MKIQMKYVASLMLMLVAMATVGFGQSNEVKREIEKTVNRFDYFRMSPVGALNSVRSGKTITVSLDGSPVELSVSPTDIRTARLQQLEGRKNITTFSGKVVGEEDSLAKINLEGKTISGVIILRGEMFGISSVSRGKNLKNAGSDETITFRSDDVKPSGLEDRVIGAALSHSIKPLGKLRRYQGEVSFKKAAFSPSNASGAVPMGTPVPISPMRTIDTFILSDLEWYNIHGGRNGDQLTPIDAHINASNAIFEYQIGVTKVVSFYRLTKSRDGVTQDPYTPTTTTTYEQTLSNVASFLHANFPVNNPYPRDIAILFSGHHPSSVEPDVVGAAYGDQSCTYYGVGMVGYDNVFPTGQILAHEVGHMIGHGSPPEHTFDNTLMTAVGVSLNMLSGYSSDRIISFLLTHPAALCIQ